MINYYTSTTNTRGQINAVLDIQETSTVYGYEDEPVTVAEFKTYAQLDAYYTGDDALISSLLITSRLILERYTALSFLPRRICVQLQNDCGGIELPYGPVIGTIDDTLITDVEGEETEVVITGLQFKTLETPISFVQLFYDVGYYVLPEALKTAIKAQCFFLWQNRGEQQGLGQDGDSRYNPDYVCSAAKQLCLKYRRVWDIML